MENTGDVILTGPLLRAARALVEISAAELAISSGVGERTILRAERSDGPLAMRQSNLNAIVAVLEARGVVFLAADVAGGAGLRFAGASV